MNIEVTEVKENHWEVHENCSFIGEIKRKSNGGWDAVFPDGTHPKFSEDIVNDPWVGSMVQAIKKIKGF